MKPVQVVSDCKMSSRFLTGTTPWAEIDFLRLERQKRRMRKQQTVDLINWTFFFLCVCVRTICHAQLRKPFLWARIQFAGLLVLVQLTRIQMNSALRQHPHRGSEGLPFAQQRADAVECLGLINQSSSFLKLQSVRRFQLRLSPAAAVRDTVSGLMWGLYFSSRLQTGSLKLQQV